MGLDRRGGQNICIVKCHTGRVLLYYAEGYIKKGTPKVFRHGEVVTKHSESLAEYCVSNCLEYCKSITGSAKWITIIVWRETNR